MATFLTADRVISGDDVWKGGGVRFEGDEILDAGSDVEPASDDRTYTLSGHTLMPGLIDGHVHITGTGLDPILDGKMESRYGTGVSRRDLVNTSPSQRVVRTIANARRTVESGVTTVRDLGGPADVPMVVRDAIADGVVDGPRIRAAGEGISSTGNHGDLVPSHVETFLDVEPGQLGSIGVVADGVDEVRRAVRRQIKKGADLVKVWTSASATDTEGDILPYSEEEIKAVVEEAKRHGIDVAAHAQTPSSIEASIEAGVDTIEHGMYIDKSGIDRLVENEVFLTFTYATMHSLANVDAFPDWKNEKARETLDRQLGVVDDIREAGVRVAMGSDAGSYALNNGDNAMEVVHMVEAGYSASEALRISTADTAEMLGMGDEVGLLEPGYGADIVAVRGNPLEDISVVADEDHVTLVVSQGKFVTDDT